MKRTDYTLTGVLLVVVLCIYHPVFSAVYFYTDEIVQLWYYRKGSAFHMFVPQGRHITDALFQLLFSSIDTIRQIALLRVFSLAGWMLCIPLWYYLLKKVAEREKLPPLLVFFTLFYLLASPPFTISIAWASCMELFIANTAGLISGYCCYTIITGNSAGRKKAMGMALALAFGLVSLFTYQNGFGCFLLPFLLHFLAVKRATRILGLAVMACCVLYVVYYLLFKSIVLLTHADPSGRTSVGIHPLNKLLFLFARPMNSAFHFTWIAPENGITGFIVYAILFGTWLAVHVLGNPQQPWPARFVFPATVILLLMLVYLPSLIVQENYASNRTLLAFDVAVFMAVSSTVLSAVRRQRHKRLLVAVACICFAGNAWYNLHILFLQPVTAEYRLVRKYMDGHYNPGTSVVSFIRPPRYLFYNLYGITASWDEYGLPSTYPEWVPEFFVKQVVFETTGSRAVADKLVVQHRPFAAAPLQPAQVAPAGNVLFIDVQAILSSDAALHRRAY